MDRNREIHPTLLCCILHCESICVLRKFEDILMHCLILTLAVKLFNLRLYVEFLESDVNIQAVRLYDNSSLTFIAEDV